MHTQSATIFSNAMAGSSSVLIVVIFTLRLGAAEGSFGGVNEAEASRGGSGLGKWLGDRKGSSTLEDKYL